jgi:ectoine hydroxylase-related dioxygenase (phytanoyl-CoA dioxygenase family)
MNIPHMSTKINYTQQIKKQGYCILPQIFNISQVEDLLNDIKTLYQETKNKISQDTPYLNTNQPNVYNLQNKNVKFIDTLLGIEKIEKILIDCLNDKWYKQIPLNQPNYILRSFGARSSNSSLPLHIDSFIPYIGDEIIAMQMVIVLEDMTLENGCTVAIPGSHQNGEYADNSLYDKAIPLTLKAGDIALWDSRIWHGTTENTTEGTRWAIIATFTRWWIKQHFNITKSIPKEIYAQLNPKYRSILGYCSEPWDTEYEGIEMKKGYDYVK